MEIAALEAFLIERLRASPANKSLRITEAFEELFKAVGLVDLPYEAYILDCVKDLLAITFEVGRSSHDTAATLGKVGGRKSGERRSIASKAWKKKVLSEALHQYTSGMSLAKLAEIINDCRRSQFNPDGIVIPVGDRAVYDYLRKLKTDEHFRD